jgi:hypothetical protein
MGNASSIQTHKAFFYSNIIIITHRIDRAATRNNGLIEPNERDRCPAFQPRME